MELTRAMAPRVLQLLLQEELEHPSALPGRRKTFSPANSFDSVQSTPADSISPTVLLSPVLSRPVRSQSAHSSPFLRGNAAIAPVSDSESELVGPTTGRWSHGNSVY
ncbi:hypothetical protein AAVH_39088, partial [Aphelenchoides avenae]